MTFLFFLVGRERGRRSRFLTMGKFGTPPCKSGQLAKDLGLEVSSARHAARLIIFEIMRSFFVGSSAPVLQGTANHAHEAL
jgi:hypothetical protein